jgi:hypothetical protein
LSDGTLNYGRGPDLPRILPDSSSSPWSLKFAPPINGRPGRLTATLAGEEGTIEIEKIPPNSNHFDRFGIVTTWIDGNSQHVYFDDLTYTVRQ